MKNKIYYAIFDVLYFIVSWPCKYYNRLKLLIKYKYNESIYNAADYLIRIVSRYSYKISFKMVRKCKCKVLNIPCDRFTQSITETCELHRNQEGMMCDKYHIFDRLNHIEYEKELKEEKKK